MNLKGKISSWMYNRYGLDQLGYALLLLYAILAIINMFVKSDVLNAITILIIAFVFFRLFSKNRERRSIENKFFEKFFNRLKAFFRLEERRLKEIKTHRFRRCQNCKTILRLKRKTGIHTVVCPRCNREIAVRIWL